MFKEKIQNLKERYAVQEVKKSVKQNPYAYGCAVLGALSFVLVCRKSTNVTVINYITPFEKE